METLVKDAAPGVELVPEKQGGKRRSLRKRDGRRRQGVLGFLERKNCPPPTQSPLPGGFILPFLASFLPLRNLGAFTTKTLSLFIQ